MGHSFNRCISPSFPFPFSMLSTPIWSLPSQGVMEISFSWTFNIHCTPVSGLICFYVPPIYNPHQAPILICGTPKTTRDEKGKIQLHLVRPLTLTHPKSSLSIYLAIRLHRSFVQTQPLGSPFHQSGRTPNRIRMLGPNHSLPQSHAVFHHCHGLVLSTHIRPRSG